MGFLLDTHTLIWWWLGDPELSSRARTVLEERTARVYVTAISGIEIAQKVRARKVDAMIEPLNRFEEGIAAEGFHHLAVRHDHAIRAGLLQGRHRDPFDRIIAAQGLMEGLTVITRDKALAAFGCEVFW